MSPTHHHRIFLSISSLCILILTPPVIDATITPAIYFSERLIRDYGGSVSLTPEQLASLLKDFREAFKPSEHYVLTTNYTSSSNSCDTSLPLSDYDECIDEWCMSAEDILRFHSLPVGDALQVAEITQISPAILTQIKTATCWEAIDEYAHESDTPAAEVWGYGLLAVTIINICSLLGVCFKPIMKKPFYRRFLMYMVALAVGALSANGVLVLIPEALGLTEDEGPLGEVHQWRMMTVLSGIYLFFLIERFLNMISKSCCKGDADEDAPGHGHQHTLAETHLDATKSADLPLDVATEEGGKKSLRDVKSVAWMIIFGDGFHNFIDGLSIGAAFVKSPLTGVSVSLAILMEELPHELGDFAILLNSGMTLKQGLCFNFMSACTCYLGFIVGVIIGEFTTGSHWVFALAGGMFLYISLVDMLPEMNTDAAEEEKKGHACSVFFLQNIGLLSGWGIIIILSIYGGNIDLEKTAATQI